MTLRFGIIGCGAIAHAHAAAQGAGAFYSDYRELLAGNVDVVTVATPHFLHAPISIAALRAGKAVLCEKPLAMTPAEGRTVLAEAAQHPGRFAVIFQNRFAPSLVAARQMLQSGELGALQGAKASLTWHRDAAYYQAAAWKGKWATEGGGVLINQAIHTLDALCWLEGAPVRVRGSVMTSLLAGSIEVEDTAMATAILPSGAPAVIFATNDYARDTPPRLTFACTKGELAVTATGLWLDGAVLESRTARVAADQKAAWGDGHQRLFAAFAHRLREVPDPLDWCLADTDALASLTLLDGIYQSSRKMDWVSLTN
ncbi:Gfo/Idh/MocA family protein [Lacticaseibacillus kribbianus]|uniref:Gfo/Idh/MocA family protein n=1 Tax=Lacticaseibacillus kribbianus TaxID=2926292 RepID=UPI001CD22759|nr:Gfo/Idh/MocA family oxidoreductase [Lacticaseibacillus kribbianus]